MAKRTNGSSTTDSKAKELQHMPQLDALRAFAVLAVVVHHAYPADKLPWGLARIPWGSGGVHLFFVLSGFLITGILLRCRDSGSQARDRWIAVRQFYIRRFLRIFPLYYFVIAVAFAVNLDPARQILSWLLTYTVNIYMAKVGYFVDHFAHFWTLAVEEHFYLIWPWLVLFAPRKWLIPTTLALICLSPLFRIYAYQSLGGDAGYILTPGCLDTLGMGSLLALLYQSNCPRETIARWLNRLALPIGLTITVLVEGSSSKVDWHLYVGLSDLGMALVFCWLVGSASRGFGGAVGRVLQSRPLLYTGKISYGIYVYHEFTPVLLLAFSRRLGFPFPRQGLAHLVVCAVGTWIVASLSWQLMEEPINNLKRYFPYRPRGTVISYEAKPAGARLS